MTLLQTLKSAYLKTITEPRLSGKVPSEEWIADLKTKLDSCNDIEDLVKVAGSERFILARIEKWEKEAPIEFIDGTWVKQTIIQ